MYKKYIFSALLLSFTPISLLCVPWTKVGLIGLGTTVTALNGYLLLYNNVVARSKVKATVNQYREAKALLKENKYYAACDKLKQFFEIPDGFHLKEAWVQREILKQVLNARAQEITYIKKLFLRAITTQLFSIAAGIVVLKEGIQR